MGIVIYSQLISVSCGVPRIPLSSTISVHTIPNTMSARPYQDNPFGTPADSRVDIDDYYGDVPVSSIFFFLNNFVPRWHELYFYPPIRHFDDHSLTKLVIGCASPVCWLIPHFNTLRRSRFSKHPPRCYITTPLPRSTTAFLRSTSLSCRIN